MSTAHEVRRIGEIQGEQLEAAQVRSSIARRLGMDFGALKPADRNVEGIVEMMLDTTRHHDQPLTAARLLLLGAWHLMLAKKPPRGGFCARRAVIRVGLVPSMMSA